MRCVKILLLLILLLPVITWAQVDTAAVRRAGIKTEAIDNNPLLRQHSFSTTTGKTRKQYTYWTTGKRIVKMACSWRQQDAAHADSITQSFYIENGKLFSASESITWGHDESDMGGWGCSYVFEKGKLVHLISLGHGKSEDDRWDPEQEVKENYRKVYTPVARHFKETGSAKLPATGKIQLSAHAPMWGATIDLEKKVFQMPDRNGRITRKKIMIIDRPQAPGICVLQSADRTLEIQLSPTNSGTCPYDFDTRDADREWTVTIFLNKEIYNGCGYWKRPEQTIRKQ